MWALGPPNPSPQGPHHPSPSTPVMQTLRTESRVPSGRSPPPSGQARTASCTRGQPCTAPRRSDLARKGGLLLGAAGTLACVLPQAVPCTELRNWGRGGGEHACPLRARTLLCLAHSPGFDLAACGACQETAEVPVPVHAGPACLWRGEGWARGPPGAEGCSAAL